MKKMYMFLAFAVLLLTAKDAFALKCNPARDVNGSADDCWVSVKVSSVETTLVSAGTVLVFDIANADFNEQTTSYQVRVSDASIDGAIVAGVAQNSIVSGATGLILARGRGDVAVKTATPFASGDALFVSTSGDASIPVSANVLGTTGKPVAFATQTKTVSGNTRTTTKAYITVV